MVHDQEENDGHAISTDRMLQIIMQEFVDLRKELKEDMAELKAELKGEMAGLKAELKGDIGSLTSEFRSFRTEVHLNQMNFMHSRQELEARVVVLEDKVGVGS